MSHRLAVYLVVEREGRVLFMMRSGGYRAGEYGLPSGKVEPDELLAEAIAREGAEEIGILVDPDEVLLRHVMERRTPTGNWLDFVYRCRGWRGEPVNAEPDKCDHLAWLPSDDPRISDYVRTALAASVDGLLFSRYDGE